MFTNLYHCSRSMLKDSQPRQLFMTSLFVVLLAKIGKKAFISYFSAHTHVDYGSDEANAIVGALRSYVRYQHGGLPVKINIPEDKNFVLAIGPHKTGMIDGATASLAIPRTLRYFATDAYDHLPFVKSFTTLFRCIPVLACPNKGKRNQAALQAGIQAAKSGENVALFPEGAMARKDKPLPTIKSGAAIIAVEAQIPIVVLKLTGLTSLNHPWLPETITTSSLYLALFSFLFQNHVVVEQVDLITSHLKEDLSHGEKNALISGIKERLKSHFHGDDLGVESPAGIRPRLQLQP